MVLRMVIGLCTTMNSGLKNVSSGNRRCDIGIQCACCIVKNQLRVMHFSHPFIFTSFFLLPSFRKLKLSYIKSSLHWRKSHFERYANDSFNINKSEVGQYVSGTYPALDLFYGIWQGYIGV